MVATDIRDMTSFKWATVTGTSPLAIKLDGDTAALALIPDSLIDPLSLIVGDRVRVELSQRKVVIHGRSAGTTATVAGEIKMIAMSAAPSGWLLCQGQVVSRTTYARLFTAIGTAFNTGGEAGTDFRLPDLRGRVAVGRDAGQTEFDTVGETGGAKTHTLSAAEMPAHSHGNPAGGQFWVGGGAAIFASGGTYSAQLAAATGNNAGGGGAHNNLQPYTVLNYIIKI